MHQRSWLLFLFLSCTPGYGARETDKPLLPVQEGQENDPPNSGPPHSINEPREGAPENPYPSDLNAPSIEMLESQMKNLTLTDHRGGSAGVSEKSENIPPDAYAFSLFLPPSNNLSDSQILNRVAPSDERIESSDDFIAPAPKPLQQNEIGKHQIINHIKNLNLSPLELKNFIEQISALYQKDQNKGAAQEQPPQPQNENSKIRLEIPAVPVEEAIPEEINQVPQDKNIKEAEEKNAPKSSGKPPHFDNRVLQPISSTVATSARKMASVLSKILTDPRVLKAVVGGMTLAAAVGLYYHSPDILAFISQHQPDLTSVVTTINSVLEKIENIPLVRMSIYATKMVHGTANVIGNVMGAILGVMGKALDSLIFSNWNHLAEGPGYTPFSIAGQFSGFVGSHIATWIALSKSIAMSVQVAKDLTKDALIAITDLPSNGIRWTDRKLRGAGRRIQDYVSGKAENALNAAGKAVKSGAIGAGNTLLKLPGMGYRGIKKLLF